MKSKNADASFKGRLTVLTAALMMLTSSYVSCQILPKLDGVNSTDAYLYMYPNPYREFQIDTSICLSLDYARKINYWSKLGIKLSELRTEEDILRNNLIAQITLSNEKILFLSEENLALQESNKILTGENYRLNTALGNASNRLTSISTSLKESEERLRKSRVATLLTGFVGAAVITILITSR